MIDHLDHIVLTTARTEQCIDFYTRVLGMKFERFGKGRMALKFGDKKAWATHLMHGTEHVYENALKGKGAMPPKGGNLTLSDAEVKAAVDYMLGAVK